MFYFSVHDIEIEDRLEYKPDFLSKKSSILTTSYAITKLLLGTSDYCLVVNDFASRLRGSNPDCPSWAEGAKQLQKYVRP